MFEHIDKNFIVPIHSLALKRNTDSYIESQAKQNKYNY